MEYNKCIHGAETKSHGRSHNMLGVGQAEINPQSRGVAKEVITRLEREWVVVERACHAYLAQPDVTIGDLVINILGFTEMHYDKAVLVGAMVDAAIFEHWEQEEAAI